MYLHDLFDEPEKVRIANEADRQLKLRLDTIEGEIGDLHSALAEAKGRADELEALAKLAVAVLGELVATHGQLPSRTEAEAAKRLSAAIKATGIAIDPNVRRTLESIASRGAR
jgi:hypothetical protein